MSRYRDEESDGDDLPSGWTRSGDDADEQRYTFRTQDETLVQGEPGSRGAGTPAGASNSDTKEANRYIMPFILLVVVFMFFMVAPPWTWWDSSPEGAPADINCGPAAMAHTVNKGDTCYGIAHHFDTTVELLKELNPKMDCDKLEIGKAICVPEMMPTR